MPEKKKKSPKIVCCDFDGVIHSYTSGWQGPRVIPDPPVTGAIDWIAHFMDHNCTVEEFGIWGEYELAIYSARSKYWRGRIAMKGWLADHGLDWTYIDNIKWPVRKPAAYLIIDDRAFCFEGKFPTHEEIRNFKTWMQKQ